jgi:hypothetical protein
MASHSDEIIACLQQSAEALIREHFIELWGYRVGDRPLKISISHTIDPDANGTAYRLKTSISFGVKVSYAQEQNADFGQPAQKPSMFSKGGIAAVRSAAA